MKKSLSLLLALALLVSLLTGLGLHALAEESDAALALYVQNERKDAELVRRYTADELKTPGTVLAVSPVSVHEETVREIRQ